MSFAAGCRSLPGVRGAAVASSLYCLTHVLEESIPFREVDTFVMGAGNHHDEMSRRLWFSTHAIGARLPAKIEDVRRANEVRSRALVLGALRARTLEHRCCWNGDSSVADLHPGIMLETPPLINACSSPACEALESKDSTEHAPFHIHPQLSGLPNSGCGAFISGNCRRGELLTFYCGALHSPVTGRIELLARSMWNRDRGSEHVLCLTDSYIVDGSPGIFHGGKRSENSVPEVGSSTAGLSRLHGEVAHSDDVAWRSKVLTARGAMWDSGSLGALLNHPPPEVRPNAMFLTVLVDASGLDADLKAELQRINWYHRVPWTFDGDRYIRTAFLIALRDVSDEELFVDYDFQEGAEPAWYQAVAADATSLARPRE